MPDEFQVGDQPITPAVDTTSAPGAEATEASAAEAPAEKPAKRTAAKKTATKKTAAKKTTAKKTTAKKTATKKTAAKAAAAAPDVAPDAAGDQQLPLDEAAADTTPVVKKTTRTRKSAAKAVPTTEPVEAEPAAETAPAAPAKKAPAKRAAKKATPAAEAPAEAGIDAGIDAEAGESAPAKPAKKAAAKKATSRSRKAQAPTEPTVAAEEIAEETAENATEETAEAAATGAPVPLFQAPDASKATKAKKSTKAKQAEPEDEADEDDETTTADVENQDGQDGESQDTDDDGDDEDQDGDDSGEGGSSSGRRRRRRGGRRRRRGGGGGGQNGDDQGDDQGSTQSDTQGDSQGDSQSSQGGGKGQRPKGDDDQSGDQPGDRSGQGGQGSKDGQDDQGEGSSSSRRRRRRRRSGEGDGGGGDDPANTVTKVRSSRTGEDQITALSGSTRLEAKKQRRREGREAGRRRAPIVSEAEFLARRESVERVMVVREREDLTQIGVLEDKVLVEHYVARESQTSLIGNVYLGRVQNVLPSMEAAFIDIGKGRNAVLYAGEVNWSALGHKEGQPRKIESVLSSGQSVLVQVTKDPIGHKGARLTSQVSLAGRFLVYVPDGTTSGISRKLPDTERARLKALLKEIVPDSAGVIVRTAAEGASEEELTRDVERLKARWEDIEKKAKGSAPQLLYGEPDLTLKVVRDLFTEDFAKLVIQGDDSWSTVQDYVQHVAPDLAERLERFEPATEGRDAGKDVFAAYRVDEQIAKGLDRKVWLPSGGSLVIDRTEAMTVVDVNTGKFTGSGGNLEETVTKNNLEAAEEIVRQLRLRDIGGIIVVDFIDMVLESNRDLVLRRLVECLGRDRTRHQVAEVTSLGLVQMTRKRIGTGLLEAFSENCTHCQGRGLVVHDHPVEPKGGGGNDDDRGGRGRRSRGGKGKGGNDQSNQGGNQAGNQAGNQGGAPSPKDVAAMARADKAAEAADSSEGQSQDAPAEESTSTPAAPETAADKAPEKAPEKPQVQQRQRRRSSQPTAAAASDPGETSETPGSTRETVSETPAPQPVADTPAPESTPAVEQSAQEPVAEQAGDKPADRAGGSSGVVTRTRRAARRTAPLTTGEAAAVVVDPTTQPSAPEPAAQAPAEAPKVVTRTRSSRSARTASQGTVPTMEQADAPSGVGEPPVSGTVEPGTADTEPASAPSVEHVPVKRKGSRKR